MQTQGQIQEKPTAAFVLSLLGGIIGILASLFFIGFALTLTQGSPYDVISNFYYILFGLGIWCLTTCAVIIYSSAKLNSRPIEHSKWGTIIIIFSIIGVGGLFGLIGGILALTYKPQFTVQPQTPASWQPSPQQNINQQPTGQFCPKCGEAKTANKRFCPNCGTPIYSPPQIQTQTFQTPASEPPTGQKIVQFCGYCGNRIAPGDIFCGECGKSTN